ncbi:hypothetical protein NliqN6_0311 [Naganishia liquefaciens]|uniref:WD40 repeat domain-containing protein n=1 Tax=Naganishia liquefaciens TaxID=104408 RepID=A0A8H3TN52_9TREE|nr:hypothetical protein NliqN6_0311 [Naganishia liquefaciens]
MSVGKMPSVSDDFVISLSLDNRPLEEIFWDTPHTAFCAVEPSPDRPQTSSSADPCIDYQREKRWIGSVGCEDGSIWLLDTGIPIKQQEVAVRINSDKPEAAIRDDSSVNSSHSRIFEGFRSPRSPRLGGPASPLLSRKSSSVAVPTVAISPPVESTAVFQNVDGIINPSDERPRSRSESVTTTYSTSSRYSNLGLLPSPTPTRAKNLAAVSQTTATARLASISANDEKMMQRGLKSQGRSTPEHVGSVTKLAAQVRSGLTEVYGKSDEDTGSKRRKPEMADDMNVEVGDFFRDSPRIPEKEKAMDDDVKEELKAEQELLRLEEQMDEQTGARKEMPQKSNSSGHILRSRLLFPELSGSAILALQDCSLPGRIVVLTARGTLAIIDEYQHDIAATVDLDHISRQREVPSTRPNLSPHLRWKGLSIVSKGEVDILATYAHLPDELATEPSAAHTTIFVFQLSRTTELKLIGRTSIRGCGPVSIASNSKGGLFLLQATANQLCRYSLEFEEEKRGSDLQKSRSYAQLGSLLSPMPSRPASRAASVRESSSKPGAEDSEMTQALGRFLGRRRKDETAALHLSEFFPRTVVLGEATVVRNYQEAQWTGMLICGRSGIAWNAETAWCFTLDANFSECDTISLGAVQGCGTMQLPLNSPELLRSEVLKHCSGHIAVVGQHVLRLKPSTLDALHLDAGIVEGRLSPRMPEDTIILMQKSLYNDQLLSHPVFPYSVTGGSPILAMDQAGNLQHFQLGDLRHAKTSHSSLDSRTTCTTHLALQPTGQQLVITGDEDGWMKVWSRETSELLCADCLFNCAVQAIEPSPFTEKDTVSELYALSEDGTIAVYDLEQMALAYLIPGSRHAVEGVLLSGKDLVIAYASGKTRVWDLDTLQFRRSTGIDAAEESLVNRAWLPLFRQLHSSSRHDLGEPEQAILHLKLDSLNMKDVGVLLHTLHTWDLQGDIDNVIQSMTNVALGTRSAIRLLIGHSATQADLASWQVSGRHTAWKQLMLVALAHRFIGESETEIAATKVITFYASVLQDVVGPAFCAGDIATYIEYYNHSSLHVHQAARLLLDARMGAMVDADILELLDKEVGHLPVNMSVSTRTDSLSVNALILMAAVALRRFSVLSSTALKDIANSIQLYLQQDDDSHLQQLAIDLAGRGFDIWQNFCDPSDMLRALFSLAVRKDEDGRHHSPIAHARAAVIQLASTCGAIFITTITMDILDAKTIAQRNAIMKLCVFVARKKPSVLLPSLPRLAEAVVKSLDPTRVHMRESIQQTATVILNELVSTYPAIDFAGKTQKLAVGTHEGAVIMYDLKTATRLYVLETHHSQVSAISFSPDGRRLVTAALDDRKLTVWKVGSSFGSMFVVGGPPRQGTGPGEPFKTYDFFVADEDSTEKDPATGLPHIRISWPGERNTCLQIGKMKMTFAT